MNNKKLVKKKQVERKKEVLCKLIKDYKQLPHLWDPKNSQYHNKRKRREVLSFLGSKYNMDIGTVARKIKSLRTYFAYQHNRVLQMRAGPEPNFECPWFAYKRMLFVATTYTNKDPLKTTEQTTSTSTTANNDKISEPEFKSEHPSDSEVDEDNDIEPTIGNVEEISIDNIEEVSMDNITNDETYDIFEVTPEKCKTEVNQEPGHERDDIAIFGELTVYKIRKLNKQNRLKAQNKIINILCELEMEEMKGNQEESRFGDF